MGLRWHRDEYLYWTGLDCAVRVRSGDRVAVGFGRIDVPSKGFRMKEESNTSKKREFRFSDGLDAQRAERYIAARQPSPVNFELRKPMNSANSNVLGPPSRALSDDDYWKHLTDRATD